MTVPAEQEFRDRVSAARMRMTTGIVIRPKSAPIVRQHMRNGVAVTVRGFVPKHVPLPLVLANPAPKAVPAPWFARAKYRALVAGLPGLIKKDRILTKQIVRELWRTGFTWNDVVSSQRIAPVVRLRFRLIRVVKDARPQMSLPSLGKLFGGRDHTSILHALRKTTGLK